MNPDETQGLSLIPADDDTQFAYSISEKIATKQKQNNLGNDMVRHAWGGVTPTEFFQGATKQAEEATQQATALEDQRKTLEAEIAGIKPAPVSDQSYKHAIDSYESVLGSSPAAPALKQMNLTDTDKIMMGFALLMGASPNQAVTRFVQMKTGLVDKENAQLSQQYNDQRTQYNDQTRAAAAGLGAEEARYNLDKTASESDYTTRRKALEFQIEQLDNQEKNAYTRQKDAEKLKADAVKGAQKQLADFLDNDGSIDTEEERQAILTGLQKQEQTYGLAPGSLTSAMDAYPVGWKSLKRQVSEQKWQNDALRFELDKTKVDNQVKQFERTMKRTLDKDKVDAKYKELGLAIQQGRLNLAQAQMEFNQWLGTEQLGVSQQNANTAEFNAQTGRMKTGASTTVDGSSTKSIQNWGSEFKKMFQGSGVEQFGPGSIAASLHKKGLALDLKAKDDNPAQLEQYLNYAQQQRVPYIIYNNKSYTLKPDGTYQVKEYTGPNPHTDHVHVDWKGKSSGGLRQPTPEEFASATPPGRLPKNPPPGGGESQQSKPKPQQGSKPKPSASNSVATNTGKQFGPQKPPSKGGKTSTGSTFRPSK